jgi:hypothetical protein
MRAAARKPTTAEKPTETEEPLSPELAAVCWTPQDVLRILGNIHPDTLDRWKRRGIGPPRTVLPGRRIVFFKDTFNEWLRNREQQPKSRRSRAGRHDPAAQPLRS